MRPRVPEANVIVKDWRRADLRVALCYPNIYRVGMAGLQVRLLYALLNSREDVLCERFFLPGGGLDTLVPLSLESGRPLTDFDVVAFTFQYEWDYLNAASMLLRAGIRPEREERARSGGPIVVAGGPCVVENPMPLHDLVDVFAIGDAEVLLGTLLDGLKDVLASPSPGALRDLADVRGLFVPGASERAERVWLSSLDKSPVPLAQVLPLVPDDSPLASPFGRTFNLELTRGCGRGCRFCLIDHITRPRRDRSLEDVLSAVEEGLRLTPAEKVLLIGAGASDHPELLAACEGVVALGAKLSVPSLRPDVVSEELVRVLVAGGQRRLTIAPDGATPRLRRVINKPVEDEQVLEACRLALEGGLRAVKLYFMVGLPGETEEDVRAIGKLVRRVADLGFGPGCVHVSVNPLVPKPRTPFQWLGMADLAYARRCLKLIRSAVGRDRRVVLDGLDPRAARLQAILSLGGRELGKAIVLAASYGGGLGAWRRAVKELQLDVDRYLAPKEPGEPLPWDAIDVGVRSSWLAREYEKAFKEETTPPCWEECTECGVCGRGDR